MPQQGGQGTKSDNPRSLLRIVTPDWEWRVMFVTVGTLIFSIHTDLRMLPVSKVVNYSEKQHAK